MCKIASRSAWQQLTHKVLICHPALSYGLDVWLKNGSRAPEWAGGVKQLLKNKLPALTPAARGVCSPPVLPIAPNFLTVNNLSPLASSFPFPYLFSLSLTFCLCFFSCQLFPAVPLRSRFLFLLLSPSLPPHKDPILTFLQPFLHPPPSLSSSLPQHWLHLFSFTHQDLPIPVMPRDFFCARTHRWHLPFQHPTGPGLFPAQTHVPSLVTPSLIRDQGAGAEAAPDLAKGTSAPQARAEPALVPHSCLGRGKKNYIHIYISHFSIPVPRQQQRNQPSRGSLQKPPPRPWDAAPRMTEVTTGRNVPTGARAGRQVHPVRVHPSSRLRQPRAVSPLQAPALSAFTIISSSERSLARDCGSLLAEAAQPLLRWLEVRGLHKVRQTKQNPSVDPCMRMCSLCTQKKKRIKSR